MTTSERTVRAVHGLRTVEPDPDDELRESAALRGEPRETLRLRYSEAAHVDSADGARRRRVLLRTLTGYGRTRPDLPESCPERFDLPFLRYVWNFPEKHRPRIVNAIERFGGHLRIARLRSDRDAHEFLAMLGRS